MIALLLMLLPCPDIAEDRVDVVEVNHLYDEQGRHVFDQLIWWKWCAAESRYHVLDWRMAGCGKAPIPVRRNRYWETMWHDGETLRRVRATSYRESWTQCDPELCERQILSPDNRIKLRQSQGHRQ